jgi:spermidine synthase
MVYQDGADWIEKQAGSYDVLIVDRYVPYGPAYSLFKPAFYRHACNSLTDEGIAVFTSCSPYFHATVFCDTVENLQKLFPLVRIYLAAIPSYPGGFCSFALASKKADPLHADLHRLRCEEAKYLNREMFRAAFALPNDLKRLLWGERGEKGEDE